MTINKTTNVAQHSATKLNQNGSTVIEFPFVVLALMVLLWGFVASYRLFYTQIQLDTAAYNLVNAVSTTITESAAQTGAAPTYVSSDLAAPLLVLAKRYLPDNIETRNIGITLESYFYHSAQDKWIHEQVYAGTSCKVEKPVNQLTELKVKGAKFASIVDREAKLLQLTLCLNYSPEDEIILTLPNTLSSSSVLIGKQL
ncbi:hypothetical protein L4C33_06230 [Vibrio makurazakiensis]|uniref:tight adherence pilus pseudopilin TadF n=1 Tax=Vibrio makurazakiensis TaxID=2910250 RepID=UPI003D0F3432